LVGGGEAREFSEFVNKETVRWSRLIKEKGIKAE
jgi:hypothetical protein